MVVMFLRFNQNGYFCKLKIIIVNNTVTKQFFWVYANTNYDK